MPPQMHNASIRRALLAAAFVGLNITSNSSFLRMTEEKIGQFTSVLAWSSRICFVYAAVWRARRNREVLEGQKGPFAFSTPELLPARGSESLTYHLERRELSLAAGRRRAYREEEMHVPAERS